MNNSPVQIGTNGAVRLTVDTSGNTSLTGELSVNGNSLFMNGSSPTTYYVDSDQRSAMVHVNGGFFYVLRGSGTASTTWATGTNGRWPLVINIDNGNTEIGGGLTVNGGSSTNWADLNVGAGSGHSINAAGSIYSYTAICVGNNAGNCSGTGGVNLYANGNIRNFGETRSDGWGYFGGAVESQYFRDSNNTGYYLDPASISILNEIRFTFGYDQNDYNYYIDPSSISSLNDIRPNIIYDRQNTSYYVDPNGTTRLWNLKTDTAFATGDQLYYANAIGVSSTGVCRGGAVGPDPVLGVFTYGIGHCVSLGKYKDNQQNLSIGLNELRQLRAKEFDWNINNNGHDLGFIAEEVEAISPLLAEYTEGKLSGVKYNQMSALIVNAVQEIDIQVQSNTSRIANLEASTTNLTKRNLTVTNTTSTLNLTVTGTATINNLRVTGTTEVANLKVNGKITAAGNKPTPSVLGTSVNNAQAIIATGTDVAGSITLTTDLIAPVDGKLKIVFSTPYSSAPIVNLTAVGRDAAGLGAYVESASATELVINFFNTPTAQKTYNFNYQIIEAINP
jgi:hypothetical protein